MSTTIASLSTSVVDGLTVLASGDTLSIRLSLRNVGQNNYTSQRKSRF